MKAKKCMIDIFEILMGLGAFALGLWLFLSLMVGSVGAVEYTVPEIDPDAVYYDSRGAEAKGSELIEGIRLMMLECGSYKVCEADKREHCAVLCKQLLYTQRVGGYNGWGTTLWGVMHASNTYTQTAPRIWTADAEPTDEIAWIFWDVWCNGYATDFRVQNYRTEHYFEGDWAEPAYVIGTTWYSVNRWQDFSMFDASEIWPHAAVDILIEPVEDWFEPEGLTEKVIVRLEDR